MKAAQLIRVFREICGDYHPSEDLRFSFSVDGASVPNFVDTEHLVQYPQIQITPFIKDDLKDIFETDTLEKSLDPYENPNIDYVKHIEKTTFKEAKFAVDILTKNLEQLLKIQGILESRFENFFSVELGEFVEREWSPYNEIFYNGHYNATINIIRAYDEDNLLIKGEDIPEVEDTAGSWGLFDTGLYVNPLTDVQNLIFVDKIYGSVFSDGFSAKEKDLKNYKIVSSSQEHDKDTSTKRWKMMVQLKYRDSVERSIGRSFKEIDIDGQEN
jgi:hypothetical protein